MGFLFIFIYLAIILTVIEINVILFTFTGLERHVSRFQVISMLTGTGFTTGESELIITHPIRRKLGAFLILFGAFSLAVVISSISSILSDDFFAKEIAYVAGVLIVLLFVLKIPLLQKKLSRFFKGELKRNFDLEDLPISDVFLTNKDDFFVELPIHRSSKFIGTTLKDQLEEKEDINVLFIKRGEIIIRNERWETEIQAGDHIILYGNKRTVRNRFKEELEAHESRNISPSSQASKL